MRAAAAAARRPGARYRARISGPLLDRIDLAIDVPALARGGRAASSGMQRRTEASVVRARVAARASGSVARQGKPNARLARLGGRAPLPAPTARARGCCAGDERQSLSARAYHRVLKVARTIADLADSTRVADAHVAEAIGYRRGLDLAGCGRAGTRSPGA